MSPFFNSMQSRVIHSGLLRQFDPRLQRQIGYTLVIEKFNFS